MIKLVLSLILNYLIEKLDKQIHYLLIFNSVWLWTDLCDNNIPVLFCVHIPHVFVATDYDSSDVLLLPEGRLDCRPVGGCHGICGQTVRQKY